MQFSIKQLLGLVALVAFVLFTYLITRKPAPTPLPPPPNTGITLRLPRQGDRASFVVVIHHSREKSGVPEDRFVIARSAAANNKSPKYLQYSSSESPKKFVSSVWNDKLGYHDIYAKPEPAAYVENIQNRYEQLDQAFLAASGFRFGELAECLLFENEDHPRYQEFLAKKWRLDHHGTLILQIDLDQKGIEPHNDFVNKQNALHLLTR